MKTAGSRPRSATLLRRLLKLAAVLAVGGYLVAVAGGYLFLRYGRKIEEVRLADVALVRVAAVRQTLARQQFRQAQAAWDAKDYQQAYVYFSSAVGRDPDNLEGRLAAARFFASLGATNLELNLLEDGWRRRPESRELTERLFGRLLEVGRDRHALELLAGLPVSVRSGGNAAFLAAVELRATLVADGAPAAKGLLDRSPALREAPLAAPVVAKILWETGQQPEAIRRLAALAQGQPDALPLYFQLAAWQQETNAEQAAIDTALEAVKRFPREPAARVLLLDTGAGRIRGTPEWWREIGRYLRDFRVEPKAVFLLAELAGRRGWTDLAGTLYELAARRGQDPAMLALFYADALAQHGQQTEVRTLLEEVAQQSDDRNNPFLVQLRQREVATAAALGDRESVRESARRLAALLRGDPDTLALFRRHYEQLGLAEAVAEFSDRKPHGRTPVDGAR